MGVCPPRLSVLIEKLESANLCGLRRALLPGSYREACSIDLIPRRRRKPWLGGISMELMKRPGLRWLLSIAVSGTLLGGAVTYAQRGQCYVCYPCACSPDGGVLMCCPEKPSQC